jgi:uncharacterized protein YjeT (DUF2065 family)
MFNTLFFVVAISPIVVGLGYILKPKKMKKVQAWFRKKAEKFENRLLKSHKKVGFAFVALGMVMVYTYFQPIWVYNMVVAARVVIGVFFPEMMPADFQPVEATPMVCI